MCPFSSYSPQTKIDDANTELCDFKFLCLGILYQNILSTIEHFLNYISVEIRR